MQFASIGGWQVLSTDGRRKYVSAAERRRFLAVLDSRSPEVRALGYVLVFCGCRISEALNLSPHQIDADAGRIVFQTLKRRRLAFRAIPVPQFIFLMLAALKPAGPDRLWTMHRTTAWRHMKRTMEEAQIDGPMACCRGLRHGYGIFAAQKQVPPNLITKWMGHADGSTTAIYMDAVGWEETEFASRMWPEA